VTSSTLLQDLASSRVNSCAATEQANELYPAAQRAFIG
jgi:hypothetical protein